MVNGLYELEFGYPLHHCRVDREVRDQLVVLYERAERAGWHHELEAFQSVDTHHQAGSIIS